MFLYVFFVVAGTVLLWAGAEGFVRSSQTLAVRSGVSPLVTGLTVVAFGTSAPEMLASLAAAVDGSPDMALGNVIGSNISNICLVLGVAALIGPIVIHRHAVRVDGPVALISSAILLAMLYDGHLGRWEGIPLVLGILGYTFLRVRNSRAVEKLVSEEVTEHVLAVSNPMLGLILVGGLAGLVLGSFLFVDGAQGIASWLNVSEAVIGLTIMAVGTSLPEIATVIAASRKGLSDLVIGNVVGSNIFNILSVLGVTASIIPLPREDVNTVDLFVFAGSALILVVLMSRPRIGKWIGGTLLVAYAAYVAYLYAG